MDNNPSNDKTEKEVTFLDLYNAFLVYRKIFERFDKGAYNDASDIIGEILIKSLICEIGIKALIKNEGKNPAKEHKLDKLFNKLSSSQQHEIANKSNYTFDEFKTQLSINNDHFVGWRYFYEGNCERFHPFFINKLIDVLDTELSNIIKRQKPEA